MFGARGDYYFLKLFTHRRNLATEEELNSQAEASALDPDAALSRVKKLQRRLNGQLPICDKFQYLDVGCGNGDISIALAQLGAGNVVGIDITDRCIVSAVANARRLKMDSKVQFVHQSIHEWRSSNKFDVVLSHEALEHIENPEAFLQTLHQFVKPSGIVVLAFGPLFHSPLGDHMHDFFSLTIPWRGVLFSHEAILRLRRERHRPTDPATSLRDIVLHLNMMRYSEFLKYLHTTRWSVEFLSVNPQLKSIPPLYWLSSCLIKTPIVCDYFAASVYTILRPMPDQLQS